MTGHSILRARLLIQADRPQAATELLGLPGQAGGQQEAEVLAARAVLARLWPPGAHTPVAGPDSTALAQAAWKAERCPAAASRCSTLTAVPPGRGARWTPRAP